MQPRVPRPSPSPPTPPRKAPLYWLSGGALALVLAAGAAMTLADPALRAGQGLAPGPAAGKLLDGGWTRAYERRFEEGLTVRGPAVSFWALLRYGLFAEGDRGVLIGRDGWLFSAEEFQEARELEASLRVDGAEVREVRRELAGRGVRLVVALVPAKARVYPDKLGRYALPAGVADRYRKLQALLAGLGVPAPDLLAPLRKARQRGEVFLRSDTHWTPLGAGAAADALAGAVSGLLSEAGSPRTRFASSQGPPQEYRGDLLNFLPLGPFLERLGPRPDIVRPRLTASVEAPAGLFDQPAIPVVLVGTSYSAGELWNLEGALKTALDADVLNVAKEGQGPLAPMRALLAGSVLEEVRADVVVWEIPERYFVLP
jgi:alginate O-acetyltransferase complex protein AlgJ